MKTFVRLAAAVAFSCGLLVMSGSGSYSEYRTTGGYSTVQNNWTGISIPSTCGIYSEINPGGAGGSAYLWVVGPSGGVHSLSSTYGPWTAQATGQAAGTYEVHHIVTGTSAYADTIISW